MKTVQMQKTFDKKDTLTAKGIAILLMLFYHLFESQELLTNMDVCYRPFSTDAFLMFSGFGNICVAVFVFLSSYGITKGLMAAGETCTTADMFHMAVKRCGKLIKNFMIMYLSVNLLWFSYFDYAGLYGRGWQGLFLAFLDMTGLAQIFDTPTLNMTWWYMKTAIIIIFMVPLLYPLVKKIGKYVIILAVLLPVIIVLNEEIGRYIVVAAFGMAAAQEDWFGILSKWPASKFWQISAGTACLFLSVLLRQNYLIHTYFLWIADAPIAILLCWFGRETIAMIPGIRQIFLFLGKHSMNIFFVHTFFYMTLYRQFIYSFHYAGLILLVLTAVTLVYSVILEYLKNAGAVLLKKITISIAENFCH